MTGTTILWGQILAVVAIVRAAILIATQWTARRLSLQPQLAYAPRIFLQGAAIGTSDGFAAIDIAIGLSVWRARKPGPPQAFVNPTSIRAN